MPAASKITGSTHKSNFQNSEPNDTCTVRIRINPKPVAVTEWLAHLTSKQEVSHSSPATHLC